MWFFGTKAKGDQESSSESQHKAAEAEQPQARAGGPSAPHPAKPSSSSAGVTESDSTEGFSKEFSTWTEQTAYGLGAGFVVGWVKGLRDSQHLAGKYAPGKSSVYDGTFAKFRVPLNIHEASLTSARWGLKVGAFTAAFSALNIYMESKREQAMRDPSLIPQLLNKTKDGGSPISLPKADSSDGLELHIARVIPTAVAGTAVGSAFGYLRQGGARGAIVGGLLCMGIGGGIKSLEIIVEGIVKKLEEDERIKAHQQQDQDRK